MTLEELEHFFSHSYPEYPEMQVHFGVGFCRVIIGRLEEDLLKEGIDKEWYQRRYSTCCAWLLAHGDER